jgi:hypothetical protein
MRFPLWKYGLIVVITIASLIYSLPNLYPDEPAIQISGASASVPADKAMLEQATTALNVAGIAFHDAEVQEKGLAAAGGKPGSAAEGTRRGAVRWVTTMLWHSIWHRLPPSGCSRWARAP